MSMKCLMLSSTIVLAAVAAGQVCLADDKASESGEKQATESVTQSNQTHLGLGVSTLPPVLAHHLPEAICKGRGVLVIELSDGSPAEKAGLRKHDVLIGIDDQDLYSPEQLVKRVRNEKPGKEVELKYVRGGRLATVKVMLGEREMQSAVTNEWPGFNRRFNFPTIPYRPDFFTQQDDLGDDGTEWTHFESMSIRKDASGEYQAKVKYKDEDGSTHNREYTGTRQEVRDAIEADKQLPDDQRRQLLRSLDDRLDATLPQFKFPKLPSSDWSRELFNWPNVDL